MGKIKLGTSGLRPLAKTPRQIDPEYVPGDDRAEAIGWYLHLLVGQELAKGLSQSELSARTKVSQPIISNIVSGDYQPKWATVYLFADYWRKAEWELVKEALEWWKHRGGRDYAVTEIERKHRERIAAGTGKSRRG